MKLFVYTILLVISLFGFDKKNVNSYEIHTKQYLKGNTLFLVTRKFVMDKKKYFLVTNTLTLDTFLQEKNSLHVKLQNVSDKLWQTPFGKLLNQATSMTKTGGITSQTSNKQNKVYLTMDMCPSSKSGYEKKFLDIVTKTTSPLPIGIAITKKWVKFHEKDFLELMYRKDLNITWINHTSTHFYDRNLPLNENFLLHVSTDIKSEILDVEKMLLSYGITPTIFFRYPGLIADDKLMKKLKNTFYLVPLGSNAWIAKKEKTKNGSIILIHGNKNEHIGIKMLLKQLPSIEKSYQFDELNKAF